LQITYPSSINISKQHTDIMTKKIIVLGGDGFCGWPTCLGLSKAGYDVTIVDNLSRRKIDVELECESLTPIRSIHARLAKWRELTGKEVMFHYFDIAEHYHRTLTLLKEWRPDAVVHFAVSAEGSVANGDDLEIWVRIDKLPAPFPDDAVAGNTNF